MVNRAQSDSRRLPRRLLIILACIVIVAVVGYGALSRFMGLPPFSAPDGEAGLAENERLIPVRDGTLQTQISINGSIAFTNTEDLVFGAIGFVDEILVSEGEVVTAGQSLARLDTESTADLGLAIAQAHMEHADALLALEDAKQPKTPIADAEKAIVDAALALHDAQEALDELLNPKRELIAQAESEIADADLQAQTAQETLDELLTPKPAVIAAAEDAVAQARVALRDAEIAPDRDHADARSARESASRDLAVAEQNAMALSDNALTTAQNTYDERLQDYANVIYKWTGITATDADLDMAPQDFFASIAFDPEQVFTRDYDYLFPNARLEDNPNTRWNELKIFGWMALYPTSNQIQTRCDHYTYGPIRQSDTASTNGDFCVERDMRNAHDSLAAALKVLEERQAQHNASMSSAQSALTRAEHARNEAQEALDRLTDGNIGATQLQTSYDKALADYNAAQEHLDELNNPTPAEVESARKQVELAQANRDAADDALNTLHNPDAQEVAALRGNVEYAQVRLNDANTTLQELMDRRELDVELRESEVAAAQARINAAARRFEDTTLKAPWNGYIASIPVEAGQDIERYEVIMTVINSGIVNIEGAVDEIDVLSLQREASAIVTIDALPDQEFEGVIADISSTASNQQGVVTFDVTIRVDVPEDVELHEGLSAVAQVGTSEVSGIVIPLQAVQYGEDGAYLRVESADGAIVERTVRLGDSDGFYTIVNSGLSAGERIVIQALDESDLEDGEFRPRRFGGGPPGGSGRPRPAR
ncbi:MAG: efflux RND transporter periplasmic adaptor subunit [Chloroflexi bacterium]|nr:efflux RND transporter periplasmic adaptor subunit [Chloroflexota bacterium]